jgi:MoaA/NifB/PqqE/SkfB family radical SAM enzyme
MIYRVLYRGPLSSCNYACSYCPFAKRLETTAELDHDKQALERFLGWVAVQTHGRFGIFFTPWGEALVRRWYQDALVALTGLDHVERAVIQTNLSCRLDWVDRCRLERLALWATFHPSEVTRSRFVAKVRSLHERGVRLSVGVVGLREHFDDIARLREEVPAGVYVWVNAFKRISDYYSEAEAARLTSIDPYFPQNNQHHPSFGAECAAGETSFTVDGEGTMRRCHFVGGPIGNIFLPDWQSALQPRPCPKATCSCHIGYVYLKGLRQDTLYADNLLERIPRRWPLQDIAQEHGKAAHGSGEVPGSASVAADEC